MLQIKNIRKKYVTGELTQMALDDVSLCFRDNEFVAVLGPSGSGKTTLLNVVGGLDRYDDGDLIINGISTKKYRDRDWDAYRNHTIGFVFQSYNLIPHQSVLANVELALTIGGVSRNERRRRAAEALEMVGLGDQLHKKPNQMSGGQMQRVAIARALVNDPDILLADEPTGALDSATSTQVVELLKEVSKDRLVIMVTHNGELASRYATRIVKLCDGKITDDSNPFLPEAKGVEPKHQTMGKARMSFLTSLSLSANNLRTKKGRTLLTAFAGSIGIIGIALILSLSTGVDNYIDDIQKETMSSYPITLTAETFDMSAMMGIRGEMMGERQDDGSVERSDGVYSDNTSLKVSEALSSSLAKNNLTAFRQYLNSPDCELLRYVGENGIVYTYNTGFSAYSYDSHGALVNSDADIESITGSTTSGIGMGSFGAMGYITGEYATSGVAENFEELMGGVGDEAVSPLILNSYEVVYGTWPNAYDEVVLVVDKNNSISSTVLYQLGFVASDELKIMCDSIENGNEPSEIRFDYEDMCAHVFYVVPACDSYIENDDGTYTCVAGNALYTDALIDSGVKLRIVGIIRPLDDASNASVSSCVAYTSALTDYLIDHTDNSPVVAAQEANPSYNILTGMPFAAENDAQKVEDAKSYILQLNTSAKAVLWQLILQSTQQYPSVSAPSDGSMPSDGMGSTNYGNDEASMAAALDAWLADSPDESFLISFYDEYVSGSSYDDNMSAFGKVSYDAPSSISIYTDSFEDKESVIECISRYNDTVDESKRITYTDYVGLLTNSITSIVDVISYVLIAFVGVSLVVSCIMIGIITHISVLERTKEIGILRALGASKRNISQVFNAETIIIGFAAGLLGVGISALLTIPINAIIGALTGVNTVKATLPITSALILIVISVAITVLGGLIPARKAAKKDPVIALRTE